MAAVQQAMLAQKISTAVAGQQVFLAGTTNWTVPAGVTSISMVAVQPGGNSSGAAGAATTITVASVIVCRAQNGSRIGDGGGDGGADYGTDAESINPGGGGAGGYAGNGGSGGGFTVSPQAPSAGNGGGGGGGYFSTGSQGGNGGGVGLLGQGSNGAAGVSDGASGTAGSSGSGTTYGGARGSTSLASAGRGGALAYKNNVAVNPGDTVTVVVGATISGAGPGAARIIWGAGRAYPSTNTADV